MMMTIESASRRIVSSPWHLPLETVVGEKFSFFFPDQSTLLILQDDRIHTDRYPRVLTIYREFIRNLLFNEICTEQIINAAGILKYSIFFY